jgi:hypothetical protein
MYCREAPKSEGNRIALPAPRDKRPQREVHSLPLRAGSRQPHHLFDKLVVKHDIRTH